MRALPCNDSDQMAERNRSWLNIDRDYARALGITAKMAAEHGFYLTDYGDKVDWADEVQAARLGTQSIPPGSPLPVQPASQHFDTVIEVCNDTTLLAANKLVQAGQRPLVLNFASGTTPGGGFLSGSRAQEENLCRSSALFCTIEGDPMYQHHRDFHRDRFTDWAIVSPDVPVFRDDAGKTIDQPWRMSVITCAAPIAYRVGADVSRELLSQRIHRILAIGASLGYTSLVLGAWGCGAFGNDAASTANDFRSALEFSFDGVFEQIVFAITDWSPERMFLGPFCKAFGELNNPNRGLPLS